MPTLPVQLTGLRSQPLARCVVAVLRGISQVFLQKNALTGAIILVGLATYSWQLALMALLGSTVQSGAAALLGRVEAAEEGLMGYNGALVGAASSLDLASGTHAALATVLGATACLPLHALLSRLFSSRPLAPLSLPVLTAPFCAVAGVLFVLLRPLMPDAGPLTTGDHPAAKLGLGTINSVAEVFLADGVQAGSLILLALFVASWEVGVWAVLGAVVAAAAGLAVHADPDSLSGGLLGYAAVLVAISIGVTFRGNRPVMWRFGVTIAGIIATVLLRALMLQTQIPVYTWPFVVVTWALLALSARSTYSPRVGRRTASSLRPDGEPAAAQVGA